MLLEPRYGLAAIATVVMICLGHQTAPALGVARTIRVPLTQTTTQDAGTMGQPVISYGTNVDIGTPAKTFKVQFDLNLDELFVPHFSRIPFYGNLHYGNGFRCSWSSSCKKTDKTFTFEYQQCEITGKPYEDLMTFPMSHYGMRNDSQDTGGYQAAPVAMRQSFLAVGGASDARFKPLPVDGFFGLAPRSQSRAGTKNLLLSLLDHRLIDNLEFGLWFNPVLDSPQGGELMLGGQNPSLHQGQLYWHKLASPLRDQWTLRLAHVLLGNQPVSCQQAGTDCQAQLSSGLNELLGPRRDVERIYALLNTVGPLSDDSTGARAPKGLHTVDCRRQSQMPVLTFLIDGIPYGLLASNYVRRMQEGLLFKREVCYVAILPHDDADNNRWVLGTSFLGAYYSVFDMTNSQVGFGTLR